MMASAYHCMRNVWTVAVSFWPQTVDGAVPMTPGQMGYLLEAIDWRHPQQTWRPQAAG